MIRLRVADAENKRVRDRRKHNRNIFDLVEHRLRRLRGNRHEHVRLRGFLLVNDGVQHAHIAVGAFDGEFRVFPLAIAQFVQPRNQAVSGNGQHLRFVEQNHRDIMRRFWRKTALEIGRGEDRGKRDNNDQRGRNQLTRRGFRTSAHFLRDDDCREDKTRRHEFQINRIQADIQR